MKNKFQDTLNDPRNITADFVEVQHEPVEAAQKALHDAAEAYHADLDARQARLDQQTAQYTKELSQLTAKRTTLSEKITDLVGRGGMDEAAKLDAELEAISTSITTLERKKRLTDGATLKGDPALYQAAKDANEVLRDEHNEYRERLRSIEAAAKAEVDRLTALLKDVGNILFYGGSAPNAFPDFTTVDRNFRDLDRIEREWKEKHEAERKAEAEATKHRGTRYVTNCDPGHYI